MTKIKIKKTPFRFTNTWTEIEGLEVVVASAQEACTSGNPMYKFTMKLSRTKLTIKRWAD